MREEMPLPDEVALDRPSFSLQLSVPIFRKPLQTSLSKWDERLTSAEANRLLRETELSIEKRGKAVDRMAAVLILQGWMEGRESGR